MGDKIISEIVFLVPGSLHILVISFFVFWLSRTTKIIFYVCLLTLISLINVESRLLILEKKSTLHTHFPPPFLLIS